MIVPLTVFHHMPERLRCGDSFGTGAGIVAEDDHNGRYVRSIAEIVDSNGKILGWVYLADDYHGNRAEYAQGNSQMSTPDLAALHLRLVPSGVSSLALLTAPLPAGLRVRPCSNARSVQEQK